ncbi:MAG: hypothetical protein ACD_38C00038G0020 [uncultured bacterium]|nr:MAG: hypothetical protein ACD_38C00038G0020 [uncultured bacterium]OGE21070.1 MAG: hypothetical protein A2778_02440 [Candidatus Daviesbacteria bacterium RIFCSPHIGHO2_01_FULL_40_24]OGE29190.1 MAG: hypothetical protein A3C29_05140 [Candidatus Daviesbacteria bacterium RIFCSPHIGHO2_02_FULL_40_16]OGE43145.1 MAG: hypothetical protein A3A53_01145 [Candidatus Daviesbacteria bacterium RIFCSPLOWO2_01_FULL_39_23]
MKELEIAGSNQQLRLYLKALERIKNIRIMQSALNNTQGKLPGSQGIISEYVVGEEKEAFPIADENFQAVMNGVTRGAFRELKAAGLKRIASLLLFEVTVETAECLESKKR